jgi:hypothetical protein
VLRREVSDGQGSANVNPVRKILWKVQVPSKVKIFLWRALHGFKSILADQHIYVHPECPVCRQGPEDIKHLLFTCKRTKEVWKKLGLEEVINLALLVDRSGYLSF